MLLLIFNFFLVYLLFLTVRIAYLKFKMTINNSNSIVYKNKS